MPMQTCLQPIWIFVSNLGVRGHHLLVLFHKSNLTSTSNFFETSRKIQSQLIRGLPTRTPSLSQDACLAQVRVCGAWETQDLRLLPLFTLETPLSVSQKGICLSPSPFSSFPSGPSGPSRDLRLSLWEGRAVHFQQLALSLSHSLSCKNPGKEIEIWGLDHLAWERRSRDKDKAQTHLPISTD